MVRPLSPGGPFQQMMPLPPVVPGHRTDSIDPLWSSGQQWTGCFNTANLHEITFKTKSKEYTIRQLSS